MVGLLLFAGARRAKAIEYEIFVDIDSEEDLYDLEVEGQISERTFNALLLLYQTRVDINRADRDRLYALPNLDFRQVDRIVAYRTEVGEIVNLDDLTAAGVLPERLTQSIRAFVVVRSPDAPRSETSGFTRIQMRLSGKNDRYPPATAIQARVRTLRNLDIGIVGILERNRVRDVRWDEDRQGLSAEPPRTLFEVPKLYVEWDDEKWEAVAGTYRIGFGQSLVFDNTDQLVPNGFFGDFELRRENDLTLKCREVAGELSESPCPPDRVVRVTPDYKWTNRLTGVAVGAKELSHGQGWAQAYAWGSYQVHRVQQTEVVNAEMCPDPRDDENPDYAAPPVFVG